MEGIHPPFTIHSLHSKKTLGRLSKTRRRCDCRPSEILDLWLSYKRFGVFTPLGFPIDLKTISLRHNPSWQQRHNQILLVLQNYLDIRVKGSTMQLWLNNARSNVLMQILLMWRLKEELKKLFDSKRSWRIWSMPLNILPRHLEELQCYSESYLRQFYLLSY